MEGLKLVIRRNLVPFGIATYAEAVQRAQWMEQDYELHQSEYKRKVLTRNKEKTLRVPLNLQIVSLLFVRIVVKLMGTDLAS